MTLPRCSLYHVTMLIPKEILPQNSLERLSNKIPSWIIWERAIAWNSYLGSRKIGERVNSRIKEAKKKEQIVYFLGTERVDLQKYFDARLHSYEINSSWVLFLLPMSSYCIQYYTYSSLSVTLFLPLCSVKSNTYHLCFRYQRRLGQILSIFLFLLPFTAPAS